jgi:ferric-dicitrate binding protein FerR (iron transport regulator)
VNCEQADNLINARLDGELAEGDGARLDEHLTACPACRATADAAGSLDGELRSTFAARRESALAVAERVITQFHASTPETPVVRTTQASAWVRWGRPLLAAAAGFVLAVVLFRGPLRATNSAGVAVGPGSTNAGNTGVAALPATRPAVGQLALATGAVFVCPQESQDWQALASGGAVEAGMRVRTGPKVRCEFRMNDGSEVRLNAETEVTVRTPRRVEVASGQVFSSVRRQETGEAFTVLAQPAGATLTALGTAFDVSCAPGGGAATLTVVEGSVKLTAGGGESVLKGGEAIRVAHGRLEDKRQVESLMRATQWVDEILVMKGRDNAELARRIDDIFAQLGHDKMWYMNAQEVRRLGDHCVVPLSRYISSERSQRSEDDRMKRKEAARIIADVATTASVPELINLLADADGDVRYAAARALHRLTGQTQGLGAEQWRDQSLMTCAPTVVQWHGWWERNKGRFPGADPDAVKPMETVKKPAELPTKG